MSFILGLTGSIGMGKSTTANMFRELGVPVWDADEAVHRLYAKDGAAVDPISALFPSALEDGAINREALRKALQSMRDGLDRLEAIVHPLVAGDRENFIRENKGKPLIVLDIPLLLEGDGQNRVDGVAVVSTDIKTQQARVLARPGMTEENFRFILARQMPDTEKRKKADWIIPTTDMETARAAVLKIYREITDYA